MYRSTTTTFTRIALSVFAIRVQIKDFIIRWALMFTLGYPVSILTGFTKKSSNWTKLIEFVEFPVLIILVIKQYDLHQGTILRMGCERVSLDVHNEILSIIRRVSNIAQIVIIRYVQNLLCTLKLIRIKLKSLNYSLFLS